MKLVKQIFILSISLSLSCMAVAFLGMSLWVPILIGLLIGLQWGGFVWTGRKTMSFSFLGLLGLLIYGAVLNLAAGWLLGSLVMLLVSWDLSDFSENLARFAADQVAPAFVRNHIRRLLSTAAAGFVLGGLALIIKVRLGFDVTVLIGLLVFVGLAGVVKFLRGTL